MDAIGVRSPFRFSALVEWLIAAAFLVGIAVVAALIAQEFRAPVVRPIPEAVPVMATVPAAIPARAVSVPLLPLSDGREVRIGETESSIAARLGRSAEIGRQEVDRGMVGERLTRFYEYRGTRFILVFEPFERQGEAKLAAIYLR
jgi:hypothetical protein